MQVQLPRLHEVRTPGVRCQRTWARIRVLGRVIQAFGCKWPRTLLLGGVLLWLSVRFGGSMKGDQMTGGSDSGGWHARTDPGRMPRAENSGPLLTGYDWWDQASGGRRPPEDQVLMMRDDFDGHPGQGAEFALSVELPKGYHKRVRGFIGVA